MKVFNFFCEKCQMSQSTQRWSAEWHDKRLLICSAILFLIFFAFFWGMAKRAEPPEGYVFDRVPTITGTYNCCDGGGKYSKSWVGSQVVFCLGVSFYQLNTARGDCGLKNQLNGHAVNVDQFLIPTIWGSSSMVSKISSEDISYYEVDDAHMRHLWIDGSRTNAFTLAFILTVIVHGVKLIIINRKLKKIEGIKK